MKKKQLFLYFKKIIILLSRYGVDDSPHALYAAMALRNFPVTALASAPVIEQRTPRLRLSSPRFGVPADEFIRRSRQLRPYAAVMHPALRHTAMFSLDLYEQFKSITAKNKRWYDQRAKDLAIAFQQKLQAEIDNLKQQHPQATTTIEKTEL